MTTLTPSTPCREWPGARNRGGYGVKRDKLLKKPVLMHRWVVAQIHGWGAIEGKVVMHRCDNRRCYRYDHLRIGTHTDNARDMVAKGRDRPWQREVETCKHGHSEWGIRTNGNRYCKTCRNDRQNLRRRGWA